MDIVLHTAELASASASGASPRLDQPRSNPRVGTMTIKWLLSARAPSKQLRVKLPGAGTVRVDVDKHVDKALRGQRNEFTGKSKTSGQGGNGSA